jgi:polar amino acid transport system ATP-binding protein
MTAEVLDLIEELRGEGKELILVTHNMGFARRVADNCLFLDQGRIVETGTAQQVFEAPQTPELRSFLARVLKY